MYEICNKCGTKRNSEESEVCPICYADKLNDSPKARAFWRKYKRLRTDPALIESVRRSRLKYLLKHRDDPDYRIRMRQLERARGKKRRSNPVLNGILNARRKKYYLSHRDHMLALQKTRSKRYRTKMKKQVPSAQD
jgi:hypothetical protein